MTPLDEDFGGPKPNGVHVKPLAGGALVKRALKEDQRWEWMPPLADFLSDEEPSDDDALDWIVRDLIPRGEPFLWGGLWKGGKTWGALVLAACIALGRDFLGFENTLKRPGRVLVLALEDGRRRLCKRLWQVLRGLGLTPNDPTIREHLRIWDNPIRIPGDAKTLARFIAELDRWKPDVVIVDSLSRAMTGSQNDVRDAVAFTSAWREIGAGQRAVGFIHHLNKSGSGENGGERDPFDRMRGSGELLAAPRNLILMERLGAAGSTVSAVSMRGNLDIRRASFALEYRQEQRDDGRVVVTLHDRGDVQVFKERLQAEEKADKQHAKQSTVAADFEARRQIAIEIATSKGIVTAGEVATRVGLKSASSMAPVFTALVADGTLTYDRSRNGYVLAGGSQ